MKTSCLLADVDGDHFEGTCGEGPSSYFLGSQLLRQCLPVLAEDVKQLPRPYYEWREHHSLPRTKAHSLRTSDGSAGASPCLKIGILFLG